MLGFLKRIPAMLGLKRSAKVDGSGPAKLAAAKPGAGKAMSPVKKTSDAVAKPMRGRGVGRGITPPSAKSQRRGKK